MKKTVLPILFIIALSACNKKETDPVPEPEPTKDPIVALDVLNSNSGFTTVFDSAYALGGVNNQNSIGIYDFTLESNLNLNLAYYTEIATQQSPLRTFYRYTKNIGSNQFVSLPSGAGQFPINTNIFYDKVEHQFFPYSNVYANYQYKFGSTNSVVYNGDINASVSSPNPIGEPDFCFRNPVNNSGVAFGYFSTLTSGSITSIGSTFALRPTGIGSQANINHYKACLHDVYTTSGGTKKYYAIGVTVDSVNVYQINYLTVGNFIDYSVYTTTLVNSLPTTIANYSTTKRHYSADGNTLSFMLTDATNKISTYIYNFASNTLTQNLNQVTLEYSGTGSDIDLDENGNVFYTGYASNGTNTSGVSIYKKSNSGTPTLVGNDNLLKSGTVVKLRVLMGKVYIAVTAKQSGKEVYQISIIKEN